MPLPRSSKRLAEFQRSVSLAEKQNKLLSLASVGKIAKLDIGRRARKGIPEVVLAEGKDPADVGVIAKRMVEETGSAIISRAGPAYFKAVRSHLGGKGKTIRYLKRPRIILARSSSLIERTSGGRVGILTAGTSDIPIAEEAMVIAKEMGCDVKIYHDVGVAGLHRLFPPLEELVRWDADIILVVAGREGALPTVVAGLVDVPVIGVPTSRSYGFGEKGIAALAAMLQACSLGLTVVNIDGGVGAGAVAALTANRMARLRAESKTKTHR